MGDKIALKRLTASDLTFFEWHFRHQNAGNQKSINLNADVFVEQLYPAVPVIAPTMEGGVPVALTLFGPGKKGPYHLARKIVKTGSYKNWRLNGEFVYNPDDDPARFNVLKPYDLAIMFFKGDPIPSAADIVFLSETTSDDMSLHTELSQLLPSGRRSMIRLDRAELEATIATAEVPLGHPIEQFLSDQEFDAALEDVTFGTESAMRFVRRRLGRSVSAAELANARRNADLVGRDGEGLVCFFLENLKAEGILSAVEWTSNYNAASPYDFRISMFGGQEVSIDVKSTKGDFNRTIHISAAELAEAAESEKRYDIYRVYEINNDGGKLRISEGIKSFSQKVLATVKGLPDGVRPDSFSIDPAALEWGPERYVPRQDEPDDGEI